MKLLFAHIFLLLLGWFCLPTVSMCQEIDESEIAVIISSTINQDSITNEILLNIYTLRIRNWDDGTRIIVSDYRGNAQLRDEFYGYLGTQVNTIKKVWLKAQFTGRITPPRTVDKVQEMIDLVLENPGTIGYVPLNAVPENATILLILRHD